MNYREIIERTFPKLHGTDWKIKSPIDSKYNCVAWAVHSEINNGYPTCWWEPDPLNLYYWPPSLKRGDYSVKAYKAMFESLGYKTCTREDLDTKHKNIAVFEDQGRFKHVCRQRNSSIWTSKLGPKQDIDHQLEAVSGKAYGIPTIYLQKNIIS